MSENTFSLLSVPTTKSTPRVVQKFPFKIDLTKGEYKDMVFLIKDEKIQVLHKEVDTKSFSFVWLSSGWRSRDLAYALHLYLQSTKTPHSHVEKNSSKLTDNFVFALNNIPVPNTIYVRRSAIKKRLALIKKVCGYPLIVKDILGSQGKYSAYVASEKELLNVVTNLPESKDFLFQSFIPNNYDWGIMVANGKVVSGEKSYRSSDEFRNNGCNGAVEKFVNVNEIPEEIKMMAVEASALLGLSWCRADVLINKETKAPYLLEINRYPGITAGSNEESGAYIFLDSHISSLVK